MINNSRLDQFFSSKEKKDDKNQESSKEELNADIIESKEHEIEELLESEML
jgi:hypothetical protein